MRAVVVITLMTLLALATATVSFDWTVPTSNVDLSKYFRQQDVLGLDENYIYFASGSTGKRSGTFGIHRVSKSNGQGSLTAFPNVGYQPWSAITVGKKYMYVSSGSPSPYMHVIDKNSMQVVYQHKGTNRVYQTGSAATEVHRSNGYTLVYFSYSHTFCVISISPNGEFSEVQQSQATSTEFFYLPPIVGQDAPGANPDIVVFSAQTGELIGMKADLSRSVWDDDYSLLKQVSATLEYSGVLYVAGIQGSDGSAHMHTIDMYTGQQKSYPVGGNALYDGLVRVNSNQYIVARAQNYGRIVGFSPASSFQEMWTVQLTACGTMSRVTTPAYDPIGNRLYVIGYTGSNLIFVSFDPDGKSQQCGIIQGVSITTSVYLGHLSYSNGFVYGIYEVPGISAAVFSLAVSSLGSFPRTPEPVVTPRPTSPRYSDIIVKECSSSDASCNYGCPTVSYSHGCTTALTGAGSYFRQCNNQGATLLVTYYPYSSRCSGATLSTSRLDLGRCEFDQQSGNYTVLQFCEEVPPRTPLPETPPPTEPIGPRTIQTRSCTDFTCDGSCTSMAYAPGCVPVRGTSGSVLRQCSSTGRVLTMYHYPSSKICGGVSSATERLTIDTCHKDKTDSNYTYLEFCNVAPPVTPHPETPKPGSIITSECSDRDCLRSCHNETHIAGCAPASGGSVARICINNGEQLLIYYFSGSRKCVGKPYKTETLNKGSCSTNPGELTSTVLEYCSTL